MLGDNRNLFGEALGPGWCWQTDNESESTVSFKVSMIQAPNSDSCLIDALSAATKVFGTAEIAPEAMLG